MGNSNFDELMKRYLAGQVSDDEKLKIEAWLEVKKHDSPDAQLSQAEEDQLFSKIIAGSTVSDIQKFRPWHKPNSWILKVAAGIFLLCIMVFIAWYYNTTSGAREKLILNDGSLVWLQPDSKLSYFYKEKDGIRCTEFNGEALFEIAKDPDHPFEIHCGDVTLRVLGTSFSVKTLPDKVELIVLTGKVNFSVVGDSTGQIIYANEKFVYSSGQSLQSLEKTTVENTDVLLMTANTEYQMQFSGAKLSEALDKLSQKFNTAIDLKDPIGECRITVDLTDRSLKNSLDRIAELLDIHYQFLENTIIIEGRGCN